MRIWCFLGGESLLTKYAKRPGTHSKNAERANSPENYLWGSLPVTVPDMEIWRYGDMEICGTVGWLAGCRVHGAVRPTMYGASIIHGLSQAALDPP